MIYKELSCCSESWNNVLDRFPELQNAKIGAGLEAKTSANFRTISLVIFAEVTGKATYVNPNFRASFSISALRG